MGLYRVHKPAVSFTKARGLSHKVSALWQMGSHRICDDPGEAITALYLSLLESIGPNHFQEVVASVFYC
jgi:hypothetical protein